MEIEEKVSVDWLDGLAVVSLGQQQERAVTLTLRRMESLQEALEELQQAAAARRVRGVVVRGATNKLFCAGADLNLLSVIQSRDTPQLRQLLESARMLSDQQRQQFDTLLRNNDFAALAQRLSLIGKDIFQHLAKLGIPTVAAISGACVGGGLELAMHCDWIVAAHSPSIFSDGIKTEIGFPEPILGLLQGWGGIELTVERVGLRRALPLLLQGRTISPEQALRQGLIDAVVASDNLYEYAAQVARGEIHLRRQSIGLVDRVLTKTSAGRRIVAQGLQLPLLGKIVPGARDALADYPPQHYPAPHAILEAALQAAHDPAAASSFASGRFGELAVSPQSAALVHVLFFGTEAAKALAKTPSPVHHLHCLVAGAGQMGAGIAHALLRSGHRVLLFDTFPKSLDSARRHVQQAVEKDRKLTNTDRAQLLQNVRYESQLPHDLSEIDFAIEAIIENENAKRQLLGDLSRRLRPTAAIATNTSSIPIAVLAQAVVEPQRFFGMHYFNPVRKMRLVEIIRGPQTDDAVAARGAALAVAQGKFPIVVQDVPGFLVNRILSPYLNEAVKMVLEGVPITAIDDAAEQFGMVMGPLKTLDLVGFDIAREVAGILSAAYPDRMQPPSAQGGVPWGIILDELARRNILGKKSGQGFYLYGKNRASADPKPNPVFADPAFWASFSARVPPARTPELPLIQERLIGRLVDEAQRCLNEQVAGDERNSAALQIDLASVLGFGFAPFRGGVIYFARNENAAGR